jgi:hypothetical protein
MTSTSRVGNVRISPALAQQARQALVVAAQARAEAKLDAERKEGKIPEARNKLRMEVLQRLQEDTELRATVQEVRLALQCIPGGSRQEKYWNILTEPDNQKAFDFGVSDTRAKLDMDGMDTEIQEDVIKYQGDPVMHLLQSSAFAIEYGAPQTDECAAARDVANRILEGTDDEPMQDAENAVATPTPSF